jgi:hypothetical protein
MAIDQADRLNTALSADVYADHPTGGGKGPQGRLGHKPSMEGS